MRILLANDGSASAATARALVLSLPWPAGSHVEVVRVIEPYLDVYGVPGTTYVPDDRTAVDDDRAEVEAIAASLASPTLTSSGSVRIGRPASVLAETAERTFADLIVVGSRGRGAIGSMLLGSVSAEVVDHAPCPVLVARRPAVRRAIVAIDGTPLSEGLLAAVGSGGILDEAKVELLAVAPSIEPNPAVVLAGTTGMPIDWYEDSANASRAALEATLADAAARLRSAGLHVRWKVVAGDAAAEILHEAGEIDADLIAVGTHGRTGLTRLLLGSVARNVLLHTHASVLVLRRPWLGGTPRQAVDPDAVAMGAGAAG